MRRSILILLLTVSVTCQIKAQWLSGKVKGEGGGAASKVSVSFLNKANSITSNEDGSFRIFAPNLPDTLIFSSPGYEPYKVIITEKNISDPDFQVVLLNKRDTRLMGKIAGLASSSDSKLEEVMITSSGRAAKKMKYRHEGKETLSISTSYDSYDHPSLEKRKLFPKDSAIAKAGTLTAGEINDFKKWKMWEDLTADQFKKYSQDWGIELKERYSIQLVDRNRNAISNEKVFLIKEGSTDTIWKAITDNTGKAELWGRQKSLTDKVSRYKITTSDGKTFTNPSVFENGVNLITSDKACTGSDNVDISFVVDATGSMGDEIEFLKLELETLLQKTSDKYSDLSIRYSSVFYRDNGDAYVTRKIDFQNDMLKVLNFIKLQTAGGGGDYPEALDEALDVAINKLDWHTNSRARIILLILDAPPHDEKKQDIVRLMHRAAALGIRIIPVASSGTDKSTEFLMRSLALATNGTYTFLTNHSGIGNSHMEPSTDNYSVELLGSLLQRVFEQFIYTPECNQSDISKTPVLTEAGKLKLKIYPNPGTGLFSIESNKEIKEIYVADFSGKLLLKVITDQQKGKWDFNISNYPSGVYLVKYILNDGKTGAEKLVLIR